MQEVDDKKLSDLSKRFLQAISYCGLSGYKLKKDNIISSESTLTSIKKGIQLPSKKTIDAFCEKYDVSRAWLYTGEGLFYRYLAWLVSFKILHNLCRLFTETTAKIILSHFHACMSHHLAY